jgi:hypothetical protein
MLALFDILRYSFASAFWGVLITVACMALFVFLIKGWYKDATFSPVSYIIGAVLFFFLSFQCVLVVGSLKIISMTDEYEQRITSIVESVYSPSDMVSMPQASDVIDTIIDEFPILEYYISGGEFSGYSASELPHAIADELRSLMCWYIFRRILWCLGFVIVGAICVIRSMSKNYQGIRRQRVQHDRRRVSRRTRK